MRPDPQPAPLKPADILYEDNHCLALAKPPRLLTVGDDTGDLSLLDLGRQYLKERYNKPGNVFLGVVHRLDRPVSGIVLFARTSKAAARLTAQFRDRTVRKEYRALVSGTPQPQAELIDWLLKDRHLNQSEIVPPETPGALRCALRYQTVERGRRLSQLAIQLETGRSHQIRVQLAARNLFIAGDSKYGSQIRLEGAIALHATTLEFEHPTQHHPIRLELPPPAFWQELV